MRQKWMVFFFFLVAYVPLARADFTGPPVEAVFAVGALLTLGVYFGAAAIYSMFRFVLHHFGQRHSKHSWFQALLFLVTVTFLNFSDLVTDFVRAFTENLGEGADTNTYIGLHVIGFLLSGWLGSFITPQVPKREK